MPRHFRLLVGAAFAALAMVPLCAQEPDPTALQALKYRYIGPQGNRVEAIAGVPGDPNTI